MSRIFAVDPSIVNIGWCITDTESFRWGTFHPKAKDDLRLPEIRQFIISKIKDEIPDYCVVEKAAHYSYEKHKYHSGKSFSQKTMQVMSWAYAVILEAMLSCCDNVDTPLPIEYKPKRGIICMSLEDMKPILQAQLGNDAKFNEHEAHAIWMARWKAYQLKMERMRVK